MKLNTEQQQAVEYTASPLLVVAGAGSGKTRVITEKICFLIQKQNINPRHIYAVTFTNKAAREMKERLSKNLLEDVKKIHISTFHSLGLDIIRKEYLSLNLKKSFSIFDEQDCLNLLQDIIYHEGFSDLYDEKEIFYKISHWKNNLVLPKDAVNKVTDVKDFDAAKIYAKYCEYMKSYNAVDFDDLIFTPVFLLRENEDVRHKWQHKINYLLVDEYQDTNLSQYELVKLLVGTNAKFTVVGDDAQSIYAWRGACPENLDKLSQDFPDLKVIKLEQNYRSTSNILNAANSLIMKNQKLIAKKLWSTKGEGEKIFIKECADEFDETRKVAANILKYKLRERAEFKDFAILYRGNHQAKIFEQALKEQRIRYQISGTSSFFSKAEIKDIVAYLRLLANSDDDNAFLRIINVPRRQIGPKTIQQLGEYAKKREISLFAACFEMGIEQYLTAQAVSRLRNFANYMVKIADSAERGDLIANINQLRIDIDYNDWLYQTSSSEKTAEKRVKNVNDFVSWIADLYEKKEQKITLYEILHKLMLIDILENSEKDEEPDLVQLMTVHAAKGLEYPYVIVVGMEENLLPHKTSIEADDVDEERRLAYVAITRAQRQLIITYCKERSYQGEKRSVIPSRFLKEIDANYLTWEKSGEIKKMDKKEKSQFFADVKDLLK